MSLRKRISESRESRARVRAKRREERRRAERAKAGATAADRAEARAERAKAKAETKREPEQAKPSSKAKAPKPAAAKPKPGRKASKPEPEPRRERKPDAPKAEPKSKVAASKPARGGRKGLASRLRTPAKRPAGAKRGRTLGGDAGKASAWLRSVVVELLKLGREMVAIPVQLWLAIAEPVGAVVLQAWRRALRPVLIALWRYGRAGLRLAQRHVTPARAVAAVGLVAVGALAASQWLDYHSVSVGSDAYAGDVGAVAPPPEIESEIAGNAHAWVMLPLALIALVALVIALAGRRRAALLLVGVGIAVIAIGLVVDVPKGLDEGSAAVAYEGASASLLEGFWVQIAAAVVLIGCGLMLPRHLRPAPAGAAAPSGPTLFQRGAASARKLARRRPRAKRLRRPRSSGSGSGSGSKVAGERGKRKVQGAGT